MILACICLCHILTLTQGQVIHIKNGRVQGKTITVFGKSVDVFLGIPFAKPPVGSLRFKYPEPVESWEPDIKSAQKLTPSCIQPKFPYPETQRNLPDLFSEDCLHLNILKPSNIAGPLPVMVWIYGGAFNIGGIGLPLYDGQYYAAEQNVIFVSINYRLGPLGFSYLGPDTIKGNMGLMDQRMGLQWIKDNIEHFGGNPDLVTIFGQSAGAGSVSLHLLSPLSWGLFNRAILQSGSPTAAWITMSSEKARRKIAKLAELMNCSRNSDAQIHTCLKESDAQEMTDKQMLVSAEGLPFVPVVDGHFLEEEPRSLLKKKKIKQTEILHGVTKDEGGSLLAMLVKQYLNRTDIPSHFKMSPSMYNSLLDFTVATRSTVSNIPRRIFYSSFLNPEKNIYQLDVVNQLISDTEFVCPALEFGHYTSLVSTTYMYRFDHRSSLTTLPPWTGTPHSYDLEFSTGFVLGDSTGYTTNERALAKTVMTYWANFAKSGNPNKPSPVPIEWPKYDEKGKYLKLDVGGNLATGSRLRHIECVFVNDILPMIPADGQSGPTTPESIVTTAIATIAIFVFINKCSL